MLHYHVSLPCARNSILAHGLDDSKSLESPWSNYGEWDAGIYLFDSLEWAQWYAKRVEQGFNPKPDIWEVNAEGIDLVFDPSLEGDELEWSPIINGDNFRDHAFFTPYPIAVDRVSLFESSDPVQPLDLLVLAD